MVVIIKFVKLFFILCLFRCLNFQEQNRIVKYSDISFSAIEDSTVQSLRDVIKFNKKIRQNYIERELFDAEWKKIILGFQQLCPIVSIQVAALIKNHISHADTVPLEDRNNFLNNFSNLILETKCRFSDLLIVSKFLQNFTSINQIQNNFQEILSRLPKLENSALQFISTMDEIFGTTTVDAKRLESSMAGLNEVLTDDYAYLLRDDIVEVANLYLSQAEHHLSLQNHDASVNLLKFHCFKYLKRPSIKYPSNNSSQICNLSFIQSYKGFFIDLMRNFNLDHVLELSISKANYLEDFEDPINFPGLLATIVNIDFEIISKNHGTVNAMSLLTYVTFLRLTTKVQRLFTKSFYLLLCEKSLIFTPNFVDSDTEPSDNCLVYVKYFSTLLLYCECELKPSGFILPSQIGWKWLNKAFHQLYFLSSSHAGAIQCSQSFDYSCKIVLEFLEISGGLLTSIYQNAYETLLKGLTNIIIQRNTKAEGSASKLVAFIERSQKINSVSYSLGLLPFYLKNCIFLSKYDKIDKDMELLESDKKGAFMLKAKQLGVDRLRVIFNRLSSTKDSQKVAVKSLLDQIYSASRDSSEMLKYVLYKIVNHVLKDCQEEFFCEMDEGHPLKLARVVCGLCRTIDDLKDFVRRQFYVVCPILIPEIREFKQESYETKTIWLNRMVKVICVFCVMCLQPQQTPFGIPDLWSWLVRITNACVSSKLSIFYIPTIYEVSLRITAPTLLKAYGSEFMKLLIVVQSQILANFREETMKYDALKEFLQRYISTNGEDYMGFFKNS